MPQSLTQRNSTRLSGGGGILSTRFKDKMREGNHHSDLRQPNRPLLSRNLPGCARPVLDTYMLYIYIYIYTRICMYKYIYIYIYIYISDIGLSGQIYVYMVYLVKIHTSGSSYKN
jgi:hypothetical protein